MDLGACAQVAQRCLATVVVGLCCAVGATNAQTWELVWADEFDYQGLPDSARWAYDVGGDGWGNNEAQHYTDHREKNARVDGSKLIIEAHKEPYAGKDYTSARLVTKTKGDWTHGRIQVRAMLPSGRGTWPAIWMLPTNWIYGNGGWPDNGEIDIMEHVGHDAGKVHGTIHTSKYNHQRNNAKGGSQIIADAQSAFHDYSIDWTPARIDFSIDGSVYFTYRNENEGWTSWPFNHPFHLLLNIAIGGSWGGAQGIDDSIFPQQFVIDYVRVFRYLAQPQVTISASTMLAPGDTLSIMANASDPDGTVQRVKLLQADGILSQFAAPPYEYTVKGVHEGCYELSAMAVDDLGWVAHADTIALSVGNSCGKAPYLVAPHAVPGKIEAEYFDLGGQNVGYFDINQPNHGDGIRQAEGVEVYQTTDGAGYHVLASRREWLSYTANVAQRGLYTFFVRLSTQGARAAFTLAIDGQDAVVYDSPITPNQWTVVFQPDVELPKGVHDLRLTIDVNSTNVNWIRFTFLRPLAADFEGIRAGAMLHANYPNPFKNETSVSYSIERPGPVKLEVFNILGQHVATLVDHHHMPGQYHARFDGAGLGGGLYFFRLTTAQALRQRSMLLLR